MKAHVIKDYGLLILKNLDLLLEFPVETLVLKQVLAEVAKPYKCVLNSNASKLCIYITNHLWFDHLRFAKPSLGYYDMLILTTGAAW